MTPTQIKTLRHTLGENTTTFAARVSVSGRTVEDWEQGRCSPHRFVQRALAELAEKTRVKKTSRNSR